MRSCVSRTRMRKPRGNWKIRCRSGDQHFPRLQFGDPRCGDPRLGVRLSAHRQRDLPLRRPSHQQQSHHGSRRSHHRATRNCDADDLPVLVPGIGVQVDQRTIAAAVEHRLLPRWAWHGRVCITSSSNSELRACLPCRTCRPCPIRASPSRTSYSARGTTRAGQFQDRETALGRTSLMLIGHFLAGRSQLGASRDCAWTAREPAPASRVDGPSPWRTT